MLTNEIKLQKIQSQLKTNAEALQSLNDTMEALELLAQEGVDLVDHEWCVSPYQGIERKQLPLVRRALGKLRLAGKSPAHDFDTSNRISVRMQPVSKRFSHMCFTYHTKFRKGGKCKVVTQEYKSQSLVCEV